MLNSVLPGKSLGEPVRCEAQDVFASSPIVARQNTSAYKRNNSFQTPDVSSRTFFSLGLEKNCFISHIFSVAKEKSISMCFISVLQGPALEDEVRSGSMFFQGLIQTPLKSMLWSRLLIVGLSAGTVINANDHRGEYFFYVAA